VLIAIRQGWVELAGAGWFASLLFSGAQGPEFDILCHIDNRELGEHGAHFRPERVFVFNRDGEPDISLSKLCQLARRWLECVRTRPRRQYKSDRSSVPRNARNPFLHGWNAYRNFEGRFFCLRERSARQPQRKQNKEQRPKHSFHYHSSLSCILLQRNLQMTCKIYPCRPKIASDLQICIQAPPAPNFALSYIV